MADRIAAAWRGEWEQLLEEARQRGAEAAQRRTGGRLEGEALAREVLRRTALREYSKAASLLGSPGMAAPTPAVEEVLEGLLEKRDEPRVPPGRGSGPGPGVSRKHLREALRRASRVAGPGPSGSRAAHWAVLLQVIYGVRDVDPVARDVFRSFRVRRSDVILRLILPTAAPYIATGLRLAAAICLLLTLSVQIVIAAPGIGQQIVLAQLGGAIAKMYAYIVLSGVLGIALNAIFVAIERAALHWHPSFRGEVH